MPPTAPFSPLFRNKFHNRLSQCLIRQQGLLSRLRLFLSGRSFTSTFQNQILTSKLSETTLSGLKVDQDRLMTDIHLTSQWGIGKRWGSYVDLSLNLQTPPFGPLMVLLSRVAIPLKQVCSDSRSQLLIVKYGTGLWRQQSLGCEVAVDQMGNIFAVRPGKRGKDVPAIFVGSHLDTQPTGGRYDGVLGVCAGVEMLRILNDKGIETEGGVGVVNWTNEEGARFPISMMSSGVWAGSIPLEKAHANRSIIPPNDAHTVKSALESIGYLGTTPASYISSPMAAHFELHIEQGPHLISSGQKIGIVTGVQAYKWFKVEVRGRDSHTGTTSFEHRADALQVAAQIIVQSKKTATEFGSLASTGILNLKPGSTNTVPGFVQFTLDIRSPSDELLEKTVSSIRSWADRIAQESAKPVTLNWTLDFASPATKFHETCINCVEEAAISILTAKKASKLTRKMISGAGHDSVLTNTRCPTSMIFVPCRDGVSHHPEEYCSPEDCALGTSVLTGAVIRFDRWRFRSDIVFHDSASHRARR